MNTASEWSDPWSGPVFPLSLRHRRGPSSSPLIGRSISAPPTASTRSRRRGPHPPFAQRVEVNLGILDPEDRTL